MPERQEFPSRVNKPYYDRQLLVHDCLSVALTQCIRRITLQGRGPEQLGCVTATRYKLETKGLVAVESTTAAPLLSPDNTPISY